jgi:hypothetical protein
MTGIKKSAFWLCPLSVPTNGPTDVPLDFTPNSLKLQIVLAVPTGPIKIPLIAKRREVRKFQKLRQFMPNGDLWRPILTSQSGVRSISIHSTIAHCIVKRWWLQA